MSDAKEFSPQQTAATVSYALLDQALWQKFRNADRPDEFIETWLAILCREIPGAVGGMVMLGDPGVGPFAPVAFWPDKAASQNLAAVAQTALAERQGMVKSAVVDGEAVQLMASPLIVDKLLHGVCAIAFGARETGVNEIMRKMQWASGWVEVLLRRQLQAEDQELRERSRLAFDMLATVLEAQRFHQAASALVTELAMRLDCDPVSVGFVRGRRCRVVAMSHAAGFGNKMNLVRDIGAAMDEAVDQRASVLYPVAEHWEYRVSREHEELVQAHRNGSALTVPLQSNREIVGALTLQRPRGSSFDEATVDLCDAVAAVVGPVLYEKRRNDRNVFVKIFESVSTQLRRLFGPAYFGRKLATAIAVVLLAYFSVAKAEHTVTSPAVVRGTIQRTVAAPFNGYVSGEFARAGEIVREGGLLAQLDDQDLVLERLRLSTTRQQKTTEYDRAMARLDRAEAQIVRAQIEQAEAQLALIDEQLRRTSLVAPFDGYIVDGDLSQSIGTAVERGQELFKIAPLDSYRVILEVDESDMDEIAVGQKGVLRVASLPRQAMTYRIEQVTAISEQKDGRNYFRVEAALDEVGEGLRPGMQGIGKTGIEERLLIASYTRKMTEWAYLTAWRWMP